MYVFAWELIHKAYRVWKQSYSRVNNFWFNHKNSGDSFSFRPSLYSGTRLCSNIMYVTYKMGVDINEIVNPVNGVVWKN